LLTVLMVSLLAATLISGARSAKATTPFLYFPLYADAFNSNHGGLPINSFFDHEYPTYENGSSIRKTDGVNYSGAHWSSCSIGSTCYSGHSGIDYRVGPNTPFVGENSYYEPVLSVASGNVTFAGWYNTNHYGSNAGYGLHLYVEHPAGWRSLYGHLSAIVKLAGVSAPARSVVGTTGNTGNSSGEHLHLDIQRFVSGAWQPVDPFGWNGAGADPWFTASGAQSENIWLSANIAATSIPSASNTTVVDGGAGFQKWCNAQPNCPFWYSASTANAQGGSMWYTFVNGSTGDYKARWTPSLVSAGQWEVQAYVPCVNATDQAARYVVRDGNAAENTVIVDQYNLCNQWISLGIYYFSSGSNGYVTVSDQSNIVNGNWNNANPVNYVDSNTAHKLGVDAVRWIKRAP
jgi:murein DD-endopeptidase MepM/ murein hydrolase activator NlpD